MFSLEDRHFREIHIPVSAAFAQQISQDDPQAMLDFALRLRQEKDPGAVEWLRATGRKGHPLACMSAVRTVKGFFSFELVFFGSPNKTCQELL